MKTLYLLLVSMVMGTMTLADPLTLDQALAIAKEQAPQLKAAQTTTTALLKILENSGSWTSPELELESEGMGGDNDGLDQAEVTLFLSQEIPLGGKSDLDRELARIEVARREVEYLNQLLSLEEAVRKAFMDLLAAQEVSDLRETQKNLAEQLVTAARIRWESGRGSELEVLQAELAREMSLLSVIDSESKQRLASGRLASLLQRPLEDLLTVEGDYYRLTKVEAVTVTEDMPSLKGLAVDAEYFRLQARRFKAGDVPNLTLGGGVRHEAETGVDSFLLAVSLPLNFKKQGGRAAEAAMLEVVAVNKRLEAQRQQLRLELAELKVDYEGQVTQAALIENQLLPRVEKVFALSKAGVESGRFAWREALAAQLNLIETRILYLETLREAHLIRAEISKFER